MYVNIFVFEMIRLFSFFFNNVCSTAEILKDYIIKKIHVTHEFMSFFFIVLDLIYFEIELLPDMFTVLFISNITCWIHQLANTFFFLFFL